MIEERIKEHADKWHRAWNRIDVRTSWFEIDAMIQNLIRTVAAESRKEVDWQYRSLLREIAVKDKYIKELQAEIERLKADCLK